MSTETPRLHRVLTLSDLTFFLIAALVNLNSVPIVAGAGPAALAFWIIGFFLFFLPQSAAVVELSSRYPQEGGIYNWNKTAFGNFHGFMSGWCYWTNNIFYVPTLLFYIVGFTAFIGGESTAMIGTDPLMMAGISLVLLWIITGLNIMGLGVGKWIQNIGAAGTFITTAVILAIGLITIRSHGMANIVSWSTVIPQFSDWRMFGLLSIVCLNYVGLELGSVMGEEIKSPRRNIPRAAAMAGITTVVLYTLTTFSLQATIPAQEIGVIEGILQGVKRAATEIDILWIVTPIAVLMILNAAGNTSAWLAGSARIPFVIGLDRYLPAALGRLHPRYNTPYVALVVQGFASGLFIVINAVGSSVRDMYLILLQTTIVLQLIPYLYMFLALIKIRKINSTAKDGIQFFRHSLPVYIAGIAGFIMTSLGITFAFVPSADISDIWNFEFKLLLGSMSFLIPAVLIFRMNQRRMKPLPVLEQTAEAYPD